MEVGREQEDNTQSKEDLEFCKDLCSVNFQFLDLYLMGIIDRMNKIQHTNTWPLLQFGTFPQPKSTTGQLVVKLAQIK